MNKKIIQYFLIALIVIIVTTDSSNAALITGKLDVNKTLAFWTPERIKSAKPLIPKNIGFRNKTTTKSNNAVDDDPPQYVPPYDNPNNPLNYPVGMLFFNDPETGNIEVCTASVFNTQNGNIGMTAAHCLFNNNGVQYDNIAFSPGYGLGQLGPLGLIPAELVAAPAEYHDDPDTPFDYGMIRFEFNDAAGLTLQQYTGANGWVLGLDGDDIVTTVFGYPQNGDMPNCPRDGLHICVIVSHVTTGDNEYDMPGVNLGDGVSGAAWTINHDPNRNLGYMYGNHAFYNMQNGQSESPRYVPQDFNDLLEFVSDN